MKPSSLGGTSDTHRTASTFEDGGLKEAAGLNQRASAPTGTLARKPLRLPQQGQAASTRTRTPLPLTPNGTPTDGAGISMHTLNHLRIPLSMIESVADLDAFSGIKPSQLALLPKHYSAEEIGHIRAALAYAVEHPQHDFASMRPGVPYSNAQIHQFLLKIATSMQGLPDPGP